MIKNNTKQEKIKDYNMHENKTKHFYWWSTVYCSKSLIDFCSNGSLFLVTCNNNNNKNMYHYKKKKRERKKKQELLECRHLWLESLTVGYQVNMCRTSLSSGRRFPDHRVIIRSTTIILNRNEQVQHTNIEIHL